MTTRGRHPPHIFSLPGHTLPWWREVRGGMGRDGDERKERGEEERMEESRWWSREDMGESFGSRETEPASPHLSLG